MFFEAACPRSLATLLSLMFALAAQAPANVIVSNIPDPFVQHLDLAAQISSSTWFAQPFQTDAQSYILTYILAAIGDREDSPAVEAKLLDLSDLAAPITVGELTLMGALSEDIIEVVQFLPASPITLKPNKTYYFALGVSSGDGDEVEDQYYWQIAGASGNLDGDGTIPDQYAINQEAGGWTLVNGEMPLLIAVDGKPYVVPEPATIFSASLMAIAGLVAAWRFGRRS